MKIVNTKSALHEVYEFSTSLFFLCGLFDFIVTDTTTYELHWHFSGVVANMKSSAILFFSSGIL